jgi:peptidoglycan hydrolase-like protein with peptidoglycan-binding domain
MDESKKWYLMKYEDGGVFGPVDFEQIHRWALDAQISPLDKISSDEKTWLKAPMIPELEMDYLIEVSPDQYYGPTTVGAVKEFLVMGEIEMETVITNCRDGSTRTVKDFPELVKAAEETIAAIAAEEKAATQATHAGPVHTNIRHSLQQRIRDLEHSLLEERRAHETAQRLVEKLEAKLAELTVKA